MKGRTAKRWSGSHRHLTERTDMPTFDTPQPIEVVVELGVGDIHVAAADRHDTVVSVQPSNPAKPSDVAAAEQTRVELADGVLQVKASKGWKRYAFWGSGESIEVRIEVPAGSHLRGDVGIAALRTTGTLGDCRYKAGAGDITVAHVAGSAQIATGTGTIRVDRIGGPATIKNANGDVSVGEVVGDVEVRVANGKITVDRAHAAVTAKTANGDISLDEVASGVVVAQTARGKVDVGVRAGVAAWLDLHTGFGQVRNLLETTGRPEPSEETVEVRARTAFGDITVRRAGRGPTTADDELPAVTPASPSPMPTPPGSLPPSPGTGHGPEATAAAAGGMAPSNSLWSQPRSLHL
jgi:hypothetical protein